MKRVLLVNTNTEISPYPVPPLGLCLLAARIEKKYEVALFDGTFSSTEDIVRLVSDWNPDYIGFGIRNIDNMVYENQVIFFDKIRDRFTRPLKNVSGATFILGGSGFSIYPSELLDYLEVETGIVGEAENVFPELLSCLDNNIDPSGIRGVVSRNKKQKAFSGEKVKSSLDLPLADIDRFISFDPYRMRGAYSIQTKRGCAHKCIYCTYPLIEGSQYQIRDAGTVAIEIEQAHKRLGNVTFEFVDSTFNDPEDHAENICREIISKGIKPRLRTMGINPANTSKELFDLMMQAGFSQIDCTPDSGSPDMLRSLKKNFTLPQLIKTARLIKDNNLPTMWFFLLGGPGESIKTISETFDFIDKYINPEDMVHITAGLRIYPGTALHRAALSEGVVTGNNNLLEPAYYISPALGPEELTDIIKKEAAKRYFCVPSWESTPPREMLIEAMDLQAKMSVREPMFRTLLRIRKTRMGL